MPKLHYNDEVNITSDENCQKGRKIFWTQWLTAFVGKDLHDFQFNYIFFEYSYTNPCAS